MVALEDRFQTRIDEGRFAGASNVGELKQLIEEKASPEETEQTADFPTWNRSWPVRLVRRLSQATWILPLARVFAHIRVEGLDHLKGVDGPVLFASNHQSHMDVPVILAALPGRWRARIAPAMLKEFFTAHFHPAEHTWRQRFTNSLNYYLACFYFNTFPIPQREAGARHTLRYMGQLTGDGWSILIFPEGVRSPTGQIKPFRGRRGHDCVSSGGTRRARQAGRPRRDTPHRRLLCEARQGPDRLRRADGLDAATTTPRWPSKSRKR